MDILSSPDADWTRDALKAKQDQFKEHFRELSSPANAYGFQITAGPIRRHDSLAPDIASSDSLIAGLTEPSFRVYRRDPKGIDSEIRGFTTNYTWRLDWGSWSPSFESALLTVADTERQAYFGYIELFCSGVVDFGWVSVPSALVGPRKQFSTYEAVREFARVLYWADSVRRLLNSAGRVYAVQFAVHVTGAPVDICHKPTSHPGVSRTQSRVGSLEDSVTLLPPHPFNEWATGARLLGELEADLCKKSGMAYPQEVRGTYCIRARAPME